MRLLFLLLLFPCIAKAQVGAFGQLSFETFYNWNHIVVAGVTLKDHRVGGFYQAARSNEGFFYERYGLYADLCIANIDDIAIFYGGIRLAQSNDQFWGMTPHATLAWRFNKYVEVPISISMYASRVVNNIGVRILLPGRSRGKVHYSQRGALQPTTLDPQP